MIHRRTGTPAPLGATRRRHRRTARFAAVGATLVAAGAAVLAGTAGAGPGPSSAPTAGLAADGGAPGTPVAPPLPRTYVALGDSYTSGPALPDQLGPDTTPSAPSLCKRSSRDYPALVADALGYVLTDVSCGGATTADLTGPQAAGVAPQLDAVNSRTALVTVGIGGNDLGFAAIAKDCAALTPWGPTRVGPSCEAHYTSDGVDQLAARVRAVGTRVAAVLTAVRARAERARVLVVGYPDIVPAAGRGCWPKLPFTSTDLDYVRGVERELNAELARVAAAAHDPFVDTATPSASHDACTGDDTRWVEPVLPSPGTYPLHPSEVGMAGMAAAVEQVVSSTSA